MKFHSAVQNPSSKSARILALRSIHGESNFIPISLTLVCLVFVNLVLGGTPPKVLFWAHSALINILDLALYITCTRYINGQRIFMSLIPQKECNK